MCLLSRSAALRFATLASLTLLACSIHGLAYSLRSLPRGEVEILEGVHTVNMVNGNKRVSGLH